MNREDRGGHTRRSFLASAAWGTPALAVGACAGKRGAGQARAAEPPREEDISATEDLMREHGVLDRILLIYEEAIRRAQAGEDLPVREVRASTEIVRHFIEDYHERLEEKFLFPRFERAKTLTGLVATLRAQHEAGRQVTGAVLEATSAGAGAGAGADPARIASSLRSFVRMYRPHAAREDTVLFPAFHRIVSAAELRELGERFEEEEHKKLGAGGFEGAVRSVADLERELGLFDLSKFTPKQNGG